LPVSVVGTIRPYKVGEGITKAWKK